MSDSEFDNAFFKIRARCWCFTLNNYTDEDIDQVNNLDAKYLIYAREIAPTTGTPHLQGYVEFTHQRTGLSIHKKVPRARFFKRRGTPQQAADYCKKVDSEFYERGELSAQGARNDIKSVVEAIEEGASFEEILDNATSYQSLQVAKVALPYKEQKRNWITEVIWIHGPPGVGKTYTAYHSDPDARIYIHSGGIWFDGYDGHDVVIIDDFRPQDYTFKYMLHMLDEYPFMVQIKCGHRQFRPRKIYITAPHGPHAYYQDEDENREQLFRRITEIRYIPEKMFESSKDAIPSQSNTPPNSPLSPPHKSLEGSEALRSCSYP